MNSIEYSREDRRIAAKWLMLLDSLPTHKIMAIKVSFTIKTRINRAMNINNQKI